MTNLRAMINLPIKTNLFAHSMLRGVSNLRALPILLIILSLTAFTACTESSTESRTSASLFSTPEWAEQANIYEVNIRQYTDEGTFKAFSEHLPRLQAMGVDILWLMPIHPIGELNRKGSLGSYYSIRDYYAVNPEFGTDEDFRSLVQQAHNLGMAVIIDLVANHTSWDHVWTETHPEYFKTNEEGEFYPPVPDWSDVIQLDFDNPDLWNELMAMMEYWVREFDIDGYRADVAYMVPSEFWTLARRKLDQIKPVFMLAEAEEPELHQAGFDMTYAWNYAHILREAGAGNVGVQEIHNAVEEQIARFQDNDYRMFFTTNHDENSWQGSDEDLYGDNFENYAVLSATVWGMPLIYSGQETGLNKQLAFFDKDPIVWDDYEYESFYSTLLQLKKRNSALHNGSAGGTYERLETDNDEDIYSYLRADEKESVWVTLNFSNEPQTVTFTNPPAGDWMDVFDESTRDGSEPLTLQPHTFLVLESGNQE